MKLKYILPAMALALPALMNGAPAYPGMLTHTNPDGTTVEYRLNGDEYFNYCTDAEGMLMERLSDGSMKRMTINGEAVAATAENIEMLRMESSVRPSKLVRSEAPSRMPQLDSDGRTTFPTIGEAVHSLVILMEYSDTKFVTPNAKQEFDNWLNQENYSNHGAVGSARDYYIASSNGLFNPTFDVAGIVSLPQKSSYYASNGKYDKFGEALISALTAVDDEVDFSKYDFDGDGVVDTVYFIYAGYGQADTGDITTVWPHQATVTGMSGQIIVLDGVRIDPYATSNELRGGRNYQQGGSTLSGIGTFCHEFGHVLGLPDLYDPNYASDSITPGEWSVMDQGSYNGDSTCPPLYSVYEKWTCHWIEYTELEEAGRYELPSLDQECKGYRVRIPRGSGFYPKEYFIIETRSKQGWDRYLPNEGLLIWHIDYKNSYWQYNRVNSDKSHPCVHILAADGTSNPYLKNYGVTGVNATWPNAANGLNYLYPGSNISFDTYCVAGNAGCFVTDMAYDAENRVGSFDYNTITEVPTDVTTLAEPTLIYTANGFKTGFTLQWEPVEGATGYALTIWRENSSGNKYYISSCNELNIGNVTTYEVKGLSTAMLGATMYAYVRVIKDIPSSETSNMVTFVPNELSSVESFEIDDFNIYGVAGSIVAPEGAEVYNLSGVEVGKDGLAAGMYIVRYNGKTTKVVVK